MTTLNTTKWKVDSIHSQIQFKIKHLAISTATGTFKKFQGSILNDGENFDGAEVDFAIEASSISTDFADRDAHLKSPDFFNVEAFPLLTFRGVLNKSKEDYELTGDLTIRDVTKSIKWTVEFGGIGKGRFGDTRAGFEVNGKINRADYGLTWNMAAEAGGLLLGEDVKLYFNIQLVKEAQA